MAAEGHRRDTLEVFRLSGKLLAWLVLPLPTIAFILCVSLSLIYNFEASTRTHCRVPNYLPSISASIGDFTPQRYIWRIFIALHCWPRFLVAVTYYNYYRSFQVRKWPTLYAVLAAVNSSLNVTEIMCLVVLTYVSSRENYPIHEKSFISFVLFSQLYMILTCILFRWAHGQNMSPVERRSYKLKRLLFMTNFSILLLSAYFFYRHNKYCEPGMYSRFALCEYLLVACNITFHGLSWLLDLGDTNLLLVKQKKKYFTLQV